jgi:hypothetical protein
MSNGPKRRQELFRTNLARGRPQRRAGAAAHASSEMAPLWGPDLIGTRQRQRKRRLDARVASDLATDVTD